MINVQAVAPSGKINYDKFERGRSNIETQFDVKVHYSDCIFNRKRGMAGEDSQRLDDFLKAFSNPSIDLVWAIRGGFGASRVLPLLSKKKFNNKLLIGYSDITAYQWYLYKYFGMQSISGQMIQVDFNDIERKRSSYLKLFELIEKNKIVWKLDKQCEFINFKNFSGKIIGGCLSVIQKLIGTTFLPNISNHILFLEDVGEEIYRLDSLFSHLKNAGIFKHISGLILGKFLKPSTSKQNEFDSDLNDLFNEYFTDLNIPIIKNFPIGHIDNITPLPIGYYAEISETKMVFTR